MKANKVIVEAKKIVVDWNSMYYIGDYFYRQQSFTCLPEVSGYVQFARCYVEYTVKSAKNLKGTVLFDSINNKAYKKGKVYKAYVDVPAFFGSYGETVIHPMGCVFVNTSNVPKLTKSVYKYPFKLANQEWTNMSYVAYPFIMKCFDDTSDMHIYINK